MSAQPSLEGVNGLLCDGSVRFFKDSDRAGAPGKMPVPCGPGRSSPVTSTELPSASPALLHADPRTWTARVHGRRRVWRLLGRRLLEVPGRGTITLDGKPLKSRHDCLQRPWSKRASASGPIVDGAFRLVDDDGPQPGPYRVEVYSLQPTGRRSPMPTTRQRSIDETFNVVPKSYNVNSTLKAEIPPGGPKEPLVVSSGHGVRQTFQAVAGSMKDWACCAGFSVVHVPEIKLLQVGVADLVGP